MFLYGRIDYEKITLRPVEDEDIRLLTAWLNKEYIRKWYHDPEEWLTEINNRNGPRRAT